MRTDSPKTPSRTLIYPTLALCLASPLVARAGDLAGSGTNQLSPDAINQLVQRVNDLEKKAARVDELESEVQRLKDNGGAGSADAPVLKEVWPKVQFNVQGDVDYHVSDLKGDKNTFFLGDFDPLLVANLSEKGKVLGDFAVTSDNDFGSGFNFDIERLYAEYDLNDYLNIQAGRFNTDIGYYNNVFHNGTFFQTTVDRPGIYDFEDNGGILPVHTDGLSINGEIPSGSLNLHYTVELGNGRSYETNNPIFGVSDNNDFKAVNLAISAKPDWAPGWQFGGSAYHDDLTPSGLPHTDQYIFSAYTVYRTGLFEWLTEGVFICDKPSGQSADWTEAGYSEVSRKFGKFRPYARFEWQNAPAADPVLQSLGANFLVWGPTLGVRYDFAQMMALKLEFERVMQHGGEDFDQFTLQWTFRY